METGYHIYFFLPKGEPKDYEPINKYSDIFFNNGIYDITTITYDEIVGENNTFVFPSEILDDLKNVVVMVPTILDTFNSLSYSGVEYAMRIYFKYISAKKQNFRIVLLGVEEEFSFWNHCKYGNFLKCPNVDYVIFNISTIKAYRNSILPKKLNNCTIVWNECVEALKALNVKPPASYKTHHSITNEWSIYRWSKYIGVENVNIQREINDFLYFNYLKSIYSESVITTELIEFVNKTGKILLIDDEEGKGWSDFFRTFCGKSQFQAIGDEFKRMSRTEIVNLSKQTVDAFKPDVVILDLRLHDDDYGEKDPLKLSGHAVFEQIKSINKGIQVIVFSASNKIWNYLPLSYDGIAIKESPEQSVRKSYTKECVEKLGSMINRGITRGSWLKDVYARIVQISACITKSSLFIDRRDAIISNLTIAFDLLSRNDYDYNPKYLAYSYLQLYIVIEKFLEEDAIYQEINNEAWVFGKYIVARWKKIDKSSICDYAITHGPGYKMGLNLGDSQKNWWKETHFKMSSVLLFGYGIKDIGKHPWNKIKDVRNQKAGHPEKGDVTQSEFIMLLDFMNYIFNETNRRYTSIDNSLPRISSATITLMGRDCQAKLNNSDQNLPLYFDKLKPKLKVGDCIDVEIITTNGKPSALSYIIK